MSQLVILIDDDHGPMDYYVEALRHRGFSVEQIDSTDEAFRWLEKPGAEMPDLVVVDMMMPPGTRLTMEETDSGLRSGVFIARAVRERFPNVPMVALTNYTAEEDVANGLPTGTPVKAKFEISAFGFADFIKDLLNSGA